MASRGSKAGKRNLPRVRKNIDAMLTDLGNYVRRVCRMTLEAFLELHDALAPALLSTFRTGSTDTAPTGPTGGFLCTKLRLSAAIRFFAGTEVWDLMVLADYQDIGPSVGNPSQASERPYRPSLCAGDLSLPASQLPYCIDSDRTAFSRTSEEDEHSIHRVARQRSAQRGGTRMAAVNLDRHARPASLLGGGRHFSDCQGRGRPAAAELETPMDGMLRHVQEQGLVRPPIQRRSYLGTDSLK